jgi:hypothetical protein
VEFIGDAASFEVLRHRVLEGHSTDSILRTAWGGNQ